MATAITDRRLLHQVHPSCCGCANIDAAAKAAAIVSLIFSIATCNFIAIAFSFLLLAGVFSYRRSFVMIYLIYQMVWFLFLIGVGIFSIYIFANINSLSKDDKFNVCNMDVTVSASGGDDNNFKNKYNYNVDTPCDDVDRRYRLLGGFLIGFVMISFILQIWWTTAIFVFFRSLDTPYCSSPQTISYAIPHYPPPMSEPPPIYQKQEDHF